MKTVKLSRCLSEMARNVLKAGYIGIAALSIAAFSAAIANAQSLGDIKDKLNQTRKISENSSPAAAKAKSADLSCLASAKSDPLAGVAYNKLQFKFAHNSYERDETIPEMLKYDPAAKYQAGCRGIEFDCHQDKGRTGETGEWRWSVHHDGDYSQDKPQLTGYFSEIKRWADQNPGHDPIVIYIEFKDAAGDDALFTKKFDELVLSKLAGGKRDKFFKPADMLARAGNNAKDLVSAAGSAGWPTLGSLKGKFIVVITGSDGGDGGKRKEFYSARPKTVLAFVDRDCGEGNIESFPSTTSGNRLFMNLHVYHKNSGWHKFCERSASLKAFVVRGWKVNAKPLWNDCVKYGLNMLATDMVKNHDWAYIGNGPFSKITAK